jgi:hypothetical protein
MKLPSFCSPWIDWEHHLSGQAKTTYAPSMRHLPNWSGARTPEHHEGKAVVDADKGMNKGDRGRRTEQNGVSLRCHEAAPSMRAA